MKFFLPLLFLTLAGTAFSQVPTDGDYRTAGVGPANWSAVATWQVRVAGLWVAAAAAPASTNNVYVQNGHTLNVDLATASCNNFHVNTVGVTTINGNTIEVSGKLRAYTTTLGAYTTLGADGTFYSNQANSVNAANAMVTATGTGGLRFIGSSRTIVANSEWGTTDINNSLGSCHVEFALTAGETATLSSQFCARGITISAGTTVSTNFRLCPGGASGLGTGSITIASGATLSSGASYTVAGTQVISRSTLDRIAALTIQVNGTLELRGAVPVIDVTTFSNSGNVVYNSGLAQTLLAKSGNDVTAIDITSYKNVTFRTFNTKTIPAGVIVNVSDTLTLNGGNNCRLAYGAGSGLTYTAATGTLVANITSGNIALDPLTSPEWPAVSGPRNILLLQNGIEFLGGSGMSRTLAGSFTLNGGSFLLNATNSLTMANGSTINRLSGTGSFGFGTLNYGSATTDVVSVNIGSATAAPATILNSFEIPFALGPGRTNLRIWSGFTYQLNGTNKRVHNLVIDGTLSDDGVAGRRIGVEGNVTCTGTHGGTSTNLIRVEFVGNTTIAVTTSLNNLELKVSGFATMSGNLTINGELKMTTTYLVIGSNTLTLNGTYTSTLGSLRGSSTSNLTIGGTGSLGTLTFNATTPLLRNLIVNKDASLGSAVGITAGATPGSITVNTGATFTTGGFLTLLSDANGTARVANSAGTISGDVTVERFIPGIAGSRAWRFLSVPTASGTETIRSSWMNGQTPGTAGPAGQGTWITSNLSTASANGYDARSNANSTILNYNNALNTWPGVTTPTASTNIATDKGYMIFIRGDRSIQVLTSTFTTTTLKTKGALKQGTYPAVPIPVNADSYEAIGNPYASSIDLRNVARTGGTDAVFYIWDPKILPLGAFQTLTLIAGDFLIIPGGGSYGASGSIMNTVQSGQAFMAHATGSAGDVQFVENCKIAASSTVGFRPMSGGERLITNLYAINGTSTDLSDGTMVLYDDNYSDIVDGKDAKKLANFNESFGMISNGITLAVEKKTIIGVADTVYYELRWPKIRGYKLELITTKMDHPNLKGKLEDNYLGTSVPVNLDGTTTYDFAVTTDPGSYMRQRFKLIFYQSGAVPVNQLTIDANRQGKNIDVEWLVNNQVKVDGYEIEKSTDSIFFKKVFTQLATGSNGESIAYNWLDENAAPGNNYYRIKSINRSGQSNVSKVVKLTISNANLGITIYPSVITGSTINMHWKDQPKGKYDILMVNTAGQVIHKTQLFYSGGSSVQTVMIDKKISTGRYNLVVITPDQSKSTTSIFIASR